MKRKYLISVLVVLAVAGGAILATRQPVLPQPSASPTPVVATPSPTPQVSPSPVVTPSPTPVPTPRPTSTVVLKTTHCLSVNGLPDHACTPGAIDPRVTQANIQTTICVSGYTKTVRPPVSVTDPIKTERMAAYGDTDSKANYELDHLISLELGGSPASVSNLWPEPYNGANNAHNKDTVENRLHQEVCAGTITLATAQHAIATNWETAP